LGVGKSEKSVARCRSDAAPAGSEARWREEVMPGGTSGEVMLTLSRQEGEKTTEVRDCRLGVGKSENQLQDSEVMLPPAGSEARWREEVMPGGTSGEVMLTLRARREKKLPRLRIAGWGLDRAKGLLRR